MKSTFSASRCSLINSGIAAHSVAGWLVAVLAKYPDAKRVGVIGHRPHIEALTTGDLLDKQTRSRIVRHGYAAPSPPWRSDSVLLFKRSDVEQLRSSCTFRIATHLLSSWAFRSSKVSLCVIA